MDGDLFDLALRGLRQVTTVGDCRPAANPSKAIRKSSVSKVACLPDDGFVPLVNQDQLFFRVSLSAGPLCDTAASKARRSALGGTFRAAFENVWRRIPPPDRGQILDYWINFRRGFQFSWEQPDLHRPTIQVSSLPTGEAKDYVLANFGHRLTFSALVVEFEPCRLTTAIIDALVLVYRYSGREHWRLVHEKFIEPEEVWEREHRGEAIGEAYDRFYDTLEKAFARVHNRAVKKLLRRWNLEALFTQKGVTAQK